MAGVPTDRVADVTAELAPVFAGLAATEARCDEILDQGRRDAVDAAQRATERVRAIAATAEQRAAGERIDTLARAQQITEARTEAELAAARAQAERLRADAVQRIPEHVARITAAVAAMVGPDGGA
jgi:vacuolar-type H+-ATPase subunit H